MQEEKYNYKILLLTKKLEKQEYEIKEQNNNKLLDNYDKMEYEEENKRLKEENFSLRQENIDLSNNYSEEKKTIFRY